MGDPKIPDKLQKLIEHVMSARRMGSTRAADVVLVKIIELLQKYRQQPLKVMFVAMLAGSSGWLFPPERLTFPHEVVKIMSWFAYAAAGAVLVVRFILILPLLSPIVPDDTAKREARVRSYHIFCYGVSTGLTFAGFALRAMGASRKETLPFFLGAAALFVLCCRRVPADDRNQF